MRDIISFIAFVSLILLALFVVWFGLRSYGLKRPPSTYQTPLVESLVKTPNNWAEDLQSPHPWVQADFESEIWKIKSPRPMPLTDFLENQSFEKLLFFMNLNSPKALPQLRETFKKNDLWKKTIFCSRSDGILQDLRELEPQWSFCSGEIFMTKFLAFSSLGLESLLKITADVVFIHLNNLKLTPDVSKIIAEAKRQNKLVLIGPVARPLEGYFPHGWMVKNKD